MKLSISVDFRAINAAMDRHGKQARFALSGALNDVAFQLRKAQVDQFRSTFDRPTPATTASFRVLRKATKDRLEAVVGLDDRGAKSGSTGMDAPRTIGHHFTGGVRAFKQFEAAFFRLGYLAAGENIVPAADSWAITLNRYGNIPPSRIIQLISYFAGFGEQGYRANMTQRRKASLAKRGKTPSGYATINGVQYFVVPSRSRRGVFPRLLDARFDPHLAPGIWARRGIHGSDVAPVVLFVRRATYRKRFDLQRLAQDVIGRGLQPAFARRFANALRTAR